MMSAFGHKFRAVGVLLLGLSLPTGVLADTRYESSIVGLIENIHAGEADTAMAEARILADSEPVARLANLVYADLLAARAGVLDSVGGLASGDGDSLANLQRELRVRWTRHSGEIPALAERYPSSLLQMAASSRHLIYADLSQSRLYVYENQDGLPVLIKDYYVTQGLRGPGKRVEGDQRTPVGVYHTTGYISGQTLPSRYGPGALPITYPNAFDRRQKHTGYGIWIHGTEPFLQNRSPLASDGCLSLNNSDFRHLDRLISRQKHTPVIIEEQPKWVSPAFITAARESWLMRLERWRSSWESRDLSTFLAYYDSQAFTPQKGSYPEWAATKREVFAHTPSLKVSISDIELFEYPGRNGVVVAEFRQRYESPGFSSVIRKQQFWQRQAGGAWKIVLESRSPKSPPVNVVRKRKNNPVTPTS